MTLAFKARFMGQGRYPRAMRELQSAANTLTPQSSVGLLTNVTTRGVTRRARPVRRYASGLAAVGGPPRWQ